jgi:hypothetical protein
MSTFYAYPIIAAAWMAELVLAFAVPAAATSGVLLRTQHGTAIIVAADSQLTGSDGSISAGCKIVQIQKHFWALMTGIEAARGQNFYPYGIALHIGFSNQGGFTSLVAEFQTVVMQVVSGVAVAVRKDIGPEKFRQKYIIKKAPILGAIFWGVENSELKLATIDFMVHSAGKKGPITIIPNLRACPGNYCPANGTRVVLPLGNHELIDGFLDDGRNQEWLGSQSPDVLPGQLVQMEIARDPGCKCGPPIDTLHVDAQKTYWVGSRGPKCEEPY